MRICYYLLKKSLMNKTSFFVWYVSKSYYKNKNKGNVNKGNLQLNGISLIEWVKLPKQQNSSRPQNSINKSSMFRCAKNWMCLKRFFKKQKQIYSYFRGCLHRPWKSLKWIFRFSADFHIIYLLAKFSKERIKFTVHKMKFSIKDFFSKCDQIRKKLRIWSHLPEKSLMEDSIFVQWVYCLWDSFSQ